MRHPVLLAITIASAMAFVMPAHAAELQPIKRVEPEYPADALRSGTHGFVEVEYTVDAGKVASVSVVNAKPARTFETAAVRAVKQWQFAPGADGRGKVRLEFSL